MVGWMEPVSEYLGMSDDAYAAAMDALLAWFQETAGSGSDAAVFG
jgi:hypothetical protein